jgi:hypothetical protein
MNLCMFTAHYEISYVIHTRGSALYMHPGLVRPSSFWDVRYPLDSPEELQRNP